MLKTKCEYNFLGNSGIKVSNICLGTMTFGEKKNGLVPVGEAESHAILDRYVQLGGNFIDTADVYPRPVGLSEEIVGSWLVKQKRSDLVIATKVAANVGSSPNDVGLSRKHILDGVELSLKRLKTDYIDLYQTHIWDERTPIEETLSALNDLVRSGKVRYVGACNVTGWQMQKIMDVCKEKGYDKWVVLQQQYSLLSRESEIEAFAVCKNEGLGVLPWSPLKGGLLSGKYKRNVIPEGSRLKWGADTGTVNQAFPDVQNIDEKSWKVIDTLETIAKECGKSVAQVSLRWLLQKDVVPSVIIGTKSVKQLEDNFGAATGWKLSKEQMEQLDQASAREMPYPYEMIQRSNAAYR